MKIKHKESEAKQHNNNEEVYQKKERNSSNLKKQSYLSHKPKKHINCMFKTQRNYQNNLRGEIKNIHEH